MLKEIQERVEGGGACAVKAGMPGAGAAAEGQQGLLVRNASVQKADENDEGAKKGDCAPDFSGTLRGIQTTLPGVKTQPITYKKIDSSVAHAARNKFDSTDRPAFLKGLANDPQKVAQLKKAGLTDADIAMMKGGKVPPAYQVHHKVPLDASGTNDSSNLILMKNEPYHKTITNYQNMLIRGMKPGEVRRFDYPLPEGFVYPP